MSNENYKSRVIKVRSETLGLTPLSEDSVRELDEVFKENSEKVEKLFSKFKPKKRDLDVVYCVKVEFNF